MSTTRPSSSSSSRLNVASTTYVAPWSRCAGPNTSPWKLCAIMKWSRTFRLYTVRLQGDEVGFGGVIRCGSRLRIPDAVAEDSPPGARQAGHDVRQLLERA